MRGDHVIHSDTHRNLPPSFAMGDRCDRQDLRAFLWTGGDQAHGGSCRVAWPTVCRPRDLGGLGLLDLRRFGSRRAGVQQAWSTFRQNVDRAVQMAFAAATLSVIGDGQSTLFWVDCWIAGSSIQQIAPPLFCSALCQDGATPTQSLKLLRIMPCLGA